jgi:hypothetical protein
MGAITLKLDPSRLTNPNLDLRYLLPDLLVEESGGLLRGNGYDYETGSDTMLIHLLSDDVGRAAAFIADFVESTQVLGNDLKTAVEMVVES